MENRLLLERVHQLSTALDEHKKEVETLRNDNVHQAAALKVRLLQRRRPSAAPRAAPRCTLQGRSWGAWGCSLGAWSCSLGACDYLVTYRCCASARTSPRRSPRARRMLKVAPWLAPQPGSLASSDGPAGCWVLGLLHALERRCPRRSDRHEGPVVPLPTLA